MDQREAILQRIKKLKQHSESAKNLGSLHEAETFMLKAIELANEYNISMIEVDMTALNQTDEFKNWGYSEYIDITDKHLGKQVKEDILRVICRFNFTRAVFSYDEKEMYVYGNMENVDTTVWLYHFISEGLYYLAEEKYQVELKAKRLVGRTDKYWYKRDFIIGAVRGIRDKLNEQREAQASTTSAIILYNDKALKKYADTKLSLTRTKAKPFNSKPASVGHTHGYKAGRNFNVSKPLGNNQKHIS